jgi:hypothetical protein
MTKNFKQINPELKKGDRIILIHMDGESIVAGTKGEVIEKEKVPKFSKNDLGYQYRMKWYDNEGNVVSSLALIPEDDGWIYDKSYYEKESDQINEIDSRNLDDVMNYAELLLTLPKSKMKIVMEYLELIRQLGIVNMFQAGSFIGVSSDYFKDYMKMKSYEHEYDEELVEEITEMVDEVRNIVISASIEYLEKNNKEVTVRSAQRRMEIIARTCLKVFMNSK